MGTFKRVIKTGFVFFGCLTSCHVMGEVFNGPSHFSSKAFDSLIIHGPAVLTEVKANSLIVHGPTTFRKLEIESKSNFKGPTRGEEGKFTELTVYGSFQGKKIKSDSLTVLGPVNISDFTINGPAKITGSLSAKNGQFQDITLESSDVTLDNVSTKNILIKQERKQKIVFLDGKTVIAGDITFESGVGTVVLKGSNVKIEGKINGGTIKDPKTEKMNKGEGKMNNKTKNAKNA